MPFIKRNRQQVEDYIATAILYANGWATWLQWSKDARDEEAVIEATLARDHNSWLAWQARVLYSGILGGLN